jgi:hypothetical protein
MDYNEMDQEFAQLVKRAFDSGMEVEVIFEALKLCKNTHTLPKTCFASWVK